MALTELVLVRHGQSVGNLASEAAWAAHDDVIVVAERDPDVELTDLGRTQARAVGRWLASLPDPERPTAVWSSPYLRARETAALALAEAAMALPVRFDERLRDRELGILDRLTGRGIAARYPDEAQRRAHLGKLYYRPPGGESWADVALRQRSLLRDVDDGRVDGAALLVAHDAVIMLQRYVLEELTEAEVLEVAARQTVGNASLTRLCRDEIGAPWRLREFNTTAHLD